jgi:hypothetical protein
MTLTYVFAGFAVLGLVLAVSASVLARRGLKTAAVVYVANSALSFVLSGATVAVGEIRYDDCIEQVAAACPHQGICKRDYYGPVKPDCERRRAL